MSYNSAEAYQHALCMNLKSDKLSYAILHRADKVILESGELDVDSYDRPTLEKLIKQDLFKHDFGAVALTGGTSRNTLVPNEIHNSSKPEEIFKLNYPEPFEDLDFNRIPEVGIVNIFEMPTWIKAAFIFTFPRIRIVHPTTVLIKGVFDQPNFHPRAYLYIDDNDFYLLITENNKLQFFNRFDYKELADIVYHLLFVLEQKEYSQDTTNVTIFGVPADWAPLKEIQTYFKKGIKVSSKRESAEDFILAKQLLCV